MDKADSSKAWTWLKAIDAALSNADARLAFIWMLVLRPSAELAAAPNAIAASCAAALASLSISSIRSSSSDAAAALVATADAFNLAASTSKPWSPMLSSASVVIAAEECPLMIVSDATAAWSAPTGSIASSRICVNDPSPP